MGSLGTALVTGASGGLGAAFADDLARRGYDVVLTARGTDALAAVAVDLRSRHGVQAIVEPADLSVPDGAEILVAALDRRGLAPRLVVNNAGFGLNERFVDQASDRVHAMLQVNIGALTDLTRIYAARMKAGDGGHVLLVASMAAYMPAPMMAAYAASKAYVLSLGLALHVELAPKVGVSVLSPGYMETGFDAASGFVPGAGTRRTAVAPASVAGIGLDALSAGRPSVVAGTANRVGAAMTRLLPRAFLARQVLRSMGDRFAGA